MDKFGLLTTSSLNIGDEIQCLAAFRFLPRVDYLIHRERTDEFVSNEKVKLIMNHWWLWESKHFPPSDSIEPLYVSFHLQYRLRNNSFFNERVLNHFKCHEPIGCRDSGTASFLKSKGINAYFSGCMTTTLIPNPTIKSKLFSDYILCVDVPKDAVDIIKKRTNRTVLCIERHQNVCLSYEGRLKLAKFTLFLYHNAFCVVTIALHAALPSTAFETPVCVIDQETFEAKSRFDGLENCLNIVKMDEFISDPNCYDINNPPDNPKEYLKLREGIVNTCKGFTGYDYNKSIFEDDYNPIKEIAEIMPYSESNIYNSTFYIRRKPLLNASFRRVLRRVTRHGAVNQSKECKDIEILIHK